jgi:precorrin-2/cobalt-factor-2 C20-methyltransferase
MGYETELIPGIPSFCAAAARLDISLSENSDELHIIPASYGVEESMRLQGTKVFMKSGRKMAEVKRFLVENALEAKMVENCGMDSEKLYFSTEEIPEQAGYYSLFIIKDESETQRKDRRKD